MLLLDFLPVLLFFATYKLWGLMVATAVLIVVTVVMAVVTWLRTRQVNHMQLTAAALVLVFGGITLILEDEMWIKWKPTVVNWLFAAAFLASQWVTSQPLVRRLFGSGLSLPDRVWTQLNLAWVVFFVAMGGLNLWVAYAFDTDTWVNFKLFGLLGLTVVFAVAQGFYIARHAE